MVCRLDCSGYDEVKKLIADKEKDNTPLYILFTGGKDPVTNESWCPDCVKADPVIKEALSLVKQRISFINAEVGNRIFWKDQNNPFRTDEKLKIKCVPTLLKHNSVSKNHAAFLQWVQKKKPITGDEKTTQEPQRLEEAQLFDLDTVQMMFEEQ